jgi:hypothetical protein
VTAINASNGLMLQLNLMLQACPIAIAVRNKKLSNRSVSQLEIREVKAMNGNLKLSIKRSTTAPTSAPLSAMFNNRLLGFVLALWLGGSFMLDLVVMPTLYKAGMINTAAFASTGQSLFSTFNSLELVLAAIVLVAVLVRRQDRQQEAHLSLGGIGMPIVLLGIAALDRYGLTPQMGSLGMQLDWLTPVAMSPAMWVMQGFYWLLEIVKLGGCAVLLNRCFRSES